MRTDVVREISRSLAFVTLSISLAFYAGVHYVISVDTATNLLIIVVSCTVMRIYHVRAIVQYRRENRHKT